MSNYTVFEFSFYDNKNEHTYTIEVELFEQQPYNGSSLACDSDLDYFGYIDFGNVNVYDQYGNEGILSLNDNQLTNLILREWELKKEMWNEG